MKVEFNYNLYEKVLTPHGTTGIVAMAALDRGGKNYFVKSADTEQWFYEDELSKGEGL